VTMSWVTRRGEALLTFVGAKVLKDVASTLVGNALGAAAAFVAGALLANWLGPELRGEFELGLFAANAALLVLGLGLNVPVAVFVTKSPERGYWAYRFGLWLCLLSAVLSSVALVTCYRIDCAFARRWLSQEVSLGVVGVFTALAMRQLVNGLLVGLGRIHWQNLGTMCRWVGYLGLVTIMLLFAPPAAELALAAFATAALGAAIFGWVGAQPRWPGGRGASPTRAIRREVLWFGLRAQFANLFQYASYRFDVLLVGLWVGKAGLGVYAVGVMFSEALWLLPNAVGTVLLSHTSRASLEEAQARIGHVFRSAMVIIVFGAASLALFAPAVVRFYLGKPYAQVPLVTWLLLTGAVALGGTKILSNELTARGFPGVNTFIAMCGALLTVLADVLLIPPFGILGASAASTLGYSLSFALTWYVFLRRAGVPLLARGGS